MSKNNIITREKEPLYIHNILVDLHTKTNLPEDEMKKWLELEIGMSKEEVDTYTKDIHFLY